MNSACLSKAVRSRSKTLPKRDHDDSWILL
jgi:hypothetical protein